MQRESFSFVQEAVDKARPPILREQFDYARLKAEFESLQSEFLVMSDLNQQLVLENSDLRGRLKEALEDVKFTEVKCEMRV